MDMTKDPVLFQSKCYLPRVDMGVQLGLFEPNGPELSEIFNNY